MKLVHIISRLLMTFGKVFVQLLKNQSPYVIAMVITDVGLGID
jgi:hypothetical protein